jgi:hypothetical protein
MGFKIACAFICKDFVAVLLGERQLYFYFCSQPHNGSRGHLSLGEDMTMTFRLGALRG